MTELINLHDLNVKGQRVLVRVDFNVPMDGAKITDERRIEAAVPTIEYLLDQGASVIVASHLGRPDGKVVAELSLEPIAAKLGEVLDRKVEFIAEAVGQEVSARAKKLKPGEIIMLENLRFYPEEESNGIEFARELASLADAYVDDAFACVHRAHASIVGVPALLPHAAGFLVEEEFHTLHGLLEDPEPPFIAIIGGAKVADKFELLESLLKLVDTIVIGGAMANTFLLAQGYSVGKSICEPELKARVAEFISQAKERGVALVLPTDAVVAHSITKGEPTRKVAVSEIGDADLALDLGPETAEAIEAVVSKANTVFWNGTLGYTELEVCANASTAVAQAIIQSGAKSIIGGGDTAGFLDQYSNPAKFSFVSTGGGAALELLAGKDLPGIRALQQ
jgi:phosphoglycerate kinase